LSLDIWVKSPHVRNEERQDILPSDEVMILDSEDGFNVIEAEEVDSVTVIPGENRALQFGFKNG
jgi:hypothetical protein